MPRKNITSKNVGAWLGGNRGYVQSGSNADTSAKADAGGGQMEAVRGELGLGAYAAGIGATAAIGAGVAAVKSGRVAQAVNKVRGQEVLIHSSPRQNLKTIFAQTSSDRTRMLPDESLSFAARPAAKGSQRYIPDYVADLQSALRGSSVGVAGGTKPQSVYVTKAPKKTVIPYQAQGVWGRTPSNQKVVTEITMSGKTQQQLVDEIAAATRRAGQPLRPEYSRAERLRMERARKKYAKTNPPVRGRKID